MEALAAIIGNKVTIKEFACGIMICEPTTTKG
jgi:hypothetical protein